MPALSSGQTLQRLRDSISCIGSGIKGLTTDDNGLRISFETKGDHYTVAFRQDLNVNGSKINMLNVKESKSEWSL